MYEQVVIVLNELPSRYFIHCKFSLNKMMLREFSHRFQFVVSYYVLNEDIFQGIE